MQNGNTLFANAQEPDSSKQSAPTQSKADTKAEKRASRVRETGAKDKVDAKHTKLDAISTDLGGEDFTPFGIYENTARIVVHLVLRNFSSRRDIRH